MQTTLFEPANNMKLVVSSLATAEGRSRRRRRKPLQRMVPGARGPGLIGRREHRLVALLPRPGTVGAGSLIIAFLLVEGKGLSALPLFCSRLGFLFPGFLLPGFIFFWNGGVWSCDDLWSKGQPNLGKEWLFQKW